MITPMTTRFFSIVCLPALCAALAAAGVIRDGTLGAASDSRGVLVHWWSDDETGVAWYMIERSLQGSSGFVVVSNHLPTKGSGNQYQFLDETAFKTTETFYRYRITPFDSSGKVVGAQYYTNVIGGGVSSVRRTWGSIKAMFR